MPIYSIIMFAASMLFLVIGILVLRNNTNMIHDYHQTKIKESEIKQYNKSFAKGLFCIVFTLFLSGLIFLFNQSKTSLIISVIILFIGLIISFIVIGRIQKKYNGGVF